MSHSLLLVTAEMGLGHIRALIPFEIKEERPILILGQNEYSSKKSKRLWEFSLQGYEFISRSKDLLIIGDILFSFLNILLHIEPVSKGVDFKRPTFQLRLLKRLIRRGICDEIVLMHKGTRTPILTSFYAPIQFLSEDQPDTLVFCQICDSDLSRVWVPADPKKGNIHYLVPCSEALNRLLLYGVSKEKIHFTGFPIPKELVGGRGQEIAIENYEKRLSFLKKTRDISKNYPLKIAYFIGGSGAMTHIIEDAAISLKKHIKQGTIELTIVPRPRKTTINRMLKFKKRHFSTTDNFRVIDSSDFNDYFKKCNKVFEQTHVLWTKPSELVFYSALGIPLIIAPPLGAQEEANRKWVLSNNIGLDQGDPKHAEIWIKELLHEVFLWPMAKNGWVNGIRTSVYNFEKIFSSV